MMMTTTTTGTVTSAACIDPVSPVSVPMTTKKTKTFKTDCNQMLSFSLMTVRHTASLDIRCGISFSNWILFHHLEIPIKCC